MSRHRNRAVAIEGKSGLVLIIQDFDDDYADDYQAENDAFGILNMYYLMQWIKYNQL